MRIISGLIIFMYTVVFLVLGFLLVGISLGFVSNNQVEIFLNVIYGDPLNLFYTGAIGVAILILVFGYIYSVCKRRKEGRTISFRNPDGEVSISLTAIEDFIQRVARDVAEIRQLDCKVINTKRGLRVLNNVTVWAGISIPEISAKFQNMIKLKLQGMLGIEDNIEVKMHVKEVQESSKEQESSAYGGEIDYSK